MAKFVPRERKHKRLAKVKKAHLSGQDTADERSGAEAIIPESKSDREIRRSNLAAEIKAQQPENKISSKKRKRLDKYVDTKLKKEENLELLKKLATQQVDVSLLRSSKKLGRVGETKRERFSRALQEQRAGVGSHDEVLYERRPDAEAFEDEGQSEHDEEDGMGITVGVVPESKTPTFGSGLKRPLETDENGQPMIKKRKRRRKETLPTPELSEEDEDHSDNSGSASEGGIEVDEDEWNGFQSEDDVVEDSATSDDDDMTASDSDEESDESAQESAPARASAFKEWADSQRNQAVDFVSSTVSIADETIRANFRPRQPSPDQDMAISATPTAQNTLTPSTRAHLDIPRSEEIQAARLELPVVQEEQKIMEAVHGNPIVIICGETGSGKTTQIPQMLLENGYGSGMIGVTQPRRVAAISVAERVATEMGPSFRSKVAHQVRYDTNVSRDTVIKFMTDGILLREISQDFVLSKYSAIVLDEAHERSVNTDILIGMLSRIVSLRAELAAENPTKHKPLKLVIMSATLRVQDFAANQRLFRNVPPPIVHAEGRQYPVTVHFSRRTRRDYVDEMVDKVARGHRKLPPGGMLVFLTSQSEILSVSKSLKSKLGGSAAGYQTSNAVEQGRGYMPLDADDFEETQDRGRGSDYLEGEQVDDPEADSDVEVTGVDDGGADREFDVGDGALPAPRGVLKPHILPLYAALPSAQQLKVFDPPPEGYRLIVLATNVAETSLTIPGIRYVFDCGRAKEKRYDIATGVQTYEVDWISKASASQRSGRAGRTGPGHCYRLYSSAVYEQFFADHTIPEILRTPLDSTVLQLKNMDIENVVNFPFPTPPDAVQLANAESLLKHLGAIGEKNGKITDIGKEIMAFPVSPRFGKMLLLAQRNGLLAPVVVLVAGLAVGDLIIPEVQVATNSTEADALAQDESDSDGDGRGQARLDAAMQTASQERHQAYTRAQAILARWDDQSDVLKLFTAVAAHAEASVKAGAAAKLCNDFFLREKGMTEVQQLRHQLHNIVRSKYTAGEYRGTLTLPKDREWTLLNQTVAAGFIDNVAIRSDLLGTDSQEVFGRKARRAAEVPYRTLMPSGDGVDKTLSMQEQEFQRSVFVHPSSVLSHLAVKEMPDYIVYSHLSRAAPSTVQQSKALRTRMHPLTIVTAKQLAVLAEGTPLLDIGKPVGKIEELPSRDGVARRQCWVTIGLKVPGGSDGGWPLGAWKVVQARKKGTWEIESVIAR